MKAKEFLRQIEKLDLMISNKLIEREQWKSMATRTSSQIGGERVQQSGSNQKMSDAVCRYVDIDKQIDDCIDRFVDARNEVIRVIEQLEPVEYDILHKVYVQYITLYDVADMYGKSYSWVTTVHGRALKNVQYILDERDGKQNGRI